MTMQYGVSSLLVNASSLENPAISLSEPAAWETFYSGSATTSGVTVNTTSALGYPPLWRAINLIAGDVARVPLNVYARTADNGKLIDRDHPAHPLLDLRVSAVTDAMTFRETMTACALLYGNAYAAIFRNGRQEAVELVSLDTNKTFLRMVDGELWYVTQVAGQSVVLRGADVFHIKGLSLDGIEGVPLLDIMAEALGVGMAAQQFGGRFFGQGSNMSGVLMVPGHFSEEKIRNTIAAWDKMHAGLSKSHKIALLQDGTKFQPMTVSPEQAQFLQTRQYEVRATVANITGCPPHKLGDDTRTSHSSLEQENQSYLDDCLDRWFRKWEMESRLKLLSPQQRQTGSHFVEANRNAMLRMSFETRVNGYAKLMEVSALTANDVLRRENMPTIGEDGEKRYRPANWVEVGAAVEPTRRPVTLSNSGETDSTIEFDEIKGEKNTVDNVLRAMVVSSVTRSLEVERDRVVKAASREPNFLEWADTFYDQFPARCALPQMPVAPFIVHAEESRDALIDVAGVSTTDTLTQNIQDTLATWPDRVETLTNQLMKGVKHDETQFSDQ